MSVNKHPPGRAIVTFGRSYQALAAVQSLGRQGIEVVVCDEAPMMAAQFSKYAIAKFLHPPAKSDPQGYLDAMEENVKRFKTEGDGDYVLMPIHEQTRLLAEHASRFLPHCKLAAPPFPAIDQVDPKHKLTSTARRLGLPVPKTLQIENEEQLDSVVKDFRFPVFLKLPHTSGGLGLQKVARAEDLAEAYRATVTEFDVSHQDHRPLIQEAVPGDDYCVTVLVDRGTVKAALSYRNVKTYPWAGGSGAIRETVDAAPCVEIATQLLTSIGWHGVAEVDFMWDGNSGSDPYLIEVNPRFWGGLFHSIESGIDYPWMLFQLVTSGRVDSAPEALLGTRTQVPMFGVLSAIKDIREDLFEEMGQDCETGVEQIREGNVGTGLRRIARGLDRGLSVSERFKRLQAFLDENQDARTEIFSTEDPMACLGVFFGLAGLIRNGALPEQFGKR